MRNQGRLPANWCEVSGNLVSGGWEGEIINLAGPASKKNAGKAKKWGQKDSLQKELTALLIAPLATVATSFFFTLAREEGLLIGNLL
jgi:hypothetical protein